MKYLIIPLLLLTGCGSIYNGTKAVGDAWSWVTEMPEGVSESDGTEPAGEVVEKALSLFVYAGVIMFVIGVILIAFGPTKHTGLMLIAGGAGCAMTGYVIEEYAHLAIVSTIAGIALYIVHKISRSSGYALGFERGKDFEEGSI